METLAVHAGERRPGPEGSLVFPIYQGTVYSVEPGTDYHDIKYIRLSCTPTQSYVNDKLAALETAEAGVATASGMAAVTSALLTVLKKGDHLIAGACLYGGTHDFLTKHFEDLGLSYTFVDAADPGAWAKARRPTTRLFLVETIANPLMRVPRLREVVDFARR
ncbi:MAG: PLP-dependent transferase, partial [Acidobacteria bacterium]|nr:PLP-dependent transferase [Acidobacteriota bacterium]